MLVRGEDSYRWGCGMRILLFTAVALTGLLALATPVHAQTKDSEIGGKTLKEWITALETETDPSLKEKAIQSIMQFGSAARGDSGPALIKALKLQTDLGVKVNAAIAIGMVGLNDKDMPVGVDELIRLLDNAQAVARFQAAMALGRIGHPAKAALPRLTRPVTGTIHDRASWEIRKAAAIAIGSVGADPEGPETHTIAALVSALRDPCAEVRLGAVGSLGYLGPRAKTPDQQAIQSGLQGVMNDRHKSIVVGANLVLLTLDKGPGPATDLRIKLITDQLKSKDMMVRIHAAQALGSLGARARSKLPTLIEVLKDKQKEVYEAAGLAITQQFKDILTDKEIAEIGKLLQNTDAEVRCRGGHILALLDKKAGSQVDALVVTLKDREPKVVTMSCLALGAIGKPATKAIPMLRELASHKDENVQAAAYDALDKIEGKKK
jgi:HEAT repeat protein